MVEYHPFQATVLYSQLPVPPWGICPLLPCFLRRSSPSLCGFQLLPSFSPISSFFRHWQELSGYTTVNSFLHSLYHQESVWKECSEKTKEVYRFDHCVNLARVQVPLWLALWIKSEVQGLPQPKPYRGRAEQTKVTQQAAFTFAKLWFVLSFRSTSLPELEMW